MCLHGLMTICGKFEFFVLLEVDCQNLSSTGLLQVVSTSYNKPANVHGKIATSLWVFLLCTPYKRFFFIILDITRIT